MSTLTTTTPAKALPHETDLKRSERKQVSHEEEMDQPTRSHTHKVILYTAKEKNIPP